MPPRDLVALLDDIFSAFDELVAERELTKIKTTGDDYIVAAGVPDARDDHAVAIAELALAMARRWSATSAPVALGVATIRPPASARNDRTMNRPRPIP